MKKIDPQENGRDDRHARVDLVEALERQIRRRTQGRLDRLRIEQAVGRIIVRGRASSHHVKQLALLAIGEVIDPRAVDLDIQVGAGGALASREDDTGREAGSGGEEGAE